jgi:hypothetical protein
VIGVRELFLVTVLSLAAVSSALDPPSLMWEKEYFTDRYASFKHVIQTSDGGYAVSAYVSGNTAGNRPIVRMDSDGNILWYAGNIYYHQGTYWVEETADSCFIATGTAVPQSGDPVGLYLFKVDWDGNVLWNRVLNLTAGNDAGHCVTPLPDGGFAVCGAYNSYDALLMRTDAGGDTLWMRIFDTGHAEIAFRVLHHDNGLTVYVDGGQANRPILLRYSMEGALLWERSYAGAFPLPQAWGGDMCLASSFGYMIASSFWSHIGQTDELGYLLWHKEIPGSLRRDGLSLSPTMDGGCIFCGWEGLEDPPDCYASADTGITHDGWLVKLDSLGNAESRRADPTGTSFAMHPRRA